MTENPFQAPLALDGDHQSRDKRKASVLRSWLGTGLILSAIFGWAVLSWTFATGPARVAMDWGPISTGSDTFIYGRFDVPNLSSLAGPIFALAAFVAWKLIWLVIERRRVRASR